MAYDYDKLYGETRDALGPPTQVFVDFFAKFGRKPVRVLDVGCGQGRDSLFIARLGHEVVGVDISPNGIRDLTDAAAIESLAVEGIVTNIATYAPEGIFDVILIDRTLHMLDPSSQLAVLSRLLDHVAAGGWLLIADEPSNIDDFDEVIAKHAADWMVDLRRRGYLFVRRLSA